MRPDRMNCDELVKWGCEKIKNKIYQLTPELLEKADDKTTLLNLRNDIVATKLNFLIGGELNSFHFQQESNCFGVIVTAKTDSSNQKKIEELKETIADSSNQKKIEELKKTIDEKQQHIENLEKQLKTTKISNVTWVVNDIAELGVKINEQFFFLYKGISLENQGTYYREVFKREFGEVCHPTKEYDSKCYIGFHLEDLSCWSKL